MADYYEDLSVGGIRNRDQIINLNAYWRDVRMFYDGSGNLVYRCTHRLHNAATSDTDWENWKYTYGANGIDRIEGPLPGACDDRATLDWGV